MWLLVMLFKGEAYVDGGCGDLEPFQGGGFTLLNLGGAGGDLAELIICHAIFFQLIPISRERLQVDLMRY